MGFNFSKHTTQVEIDGKNYEMVVDATVSKKIADIGAKITELTEEVSDKPLEAIDKADKCLNDILVTLLGKKAIDTIFRDRADSITDKIELFSYLAGEFQRASVENLMNSTAVLKSFGIETE